ncbi:MAG: hypothetical protein Q8R36_02240 [bacterium]|nr:hypothetical protein [bacterium]
MGTSEDREDRLQDAEELANAMIAKVQQETLDLERKRSVRFSWILLISGLAGLIVSLIVIYFNI